MTMNLYQAYTDEKKLNKISKSCIPYKINDINKNSREYELFREIASDEFNTNTDQKHFFGLISLKFDLKSPIEIKIFSQLAKSAQQNSYDAFVINPMLANEALFYNGWEQGIITGHQGIDEIYKYLCRRFPSTAYIRNQHIFALNNYFVGNNKFWTAYFLFIGKIIADLEIESELETKAGLAFKGAASYFRDKSLTMRPFVIERLATEFFHQAIHSGLKIKFFKPTIEHYISKFGKFYGSEMYKLSKIKLEGSLNNNTKLILEWEHKRRKIFENHGNTLCQLDDPDEII